jgi:uncharacterized protein
MAEGETSLDLFADFVGIFRGFREGGMEFHADLALPYRNDFQRKPMHGAFLLVQLETPDEAVLGRITALSSEGKLASGSGEEFNIRALREKRPVPEDLREDYLRYRVKIRVLGVLRRNGDKLTFVASHRRLPHVGSGVAFPSENVLQEIVGHNSDGAAIGHYALGEYIYAASDERLKRPLEWMQLLEPCVYARFPIHSLVSRRSFVFARAGFGKSNLTKLLFSTLYGETPSVPKRGGRRVPVGTVIFDPDGEYFWPDHAGRPGLCDVPELEDKVVVFTSRQGPSPFYQSFVAGGVKLDIRRLKPADVIAIALAPEKQDQQNVVKLRSLSPDRWERLVDLIDREGNNADINEVARILNLDPGQSQVEANVARSNMTAIVRAIHDRSSTLMDRLMHALKNGKLCLVEEAQAVLNDRSMAAEPYIAWVKEGRKYDLGAVLITQQPGSIPNEILSQGDNWFIFHLLSAGDLQNLKKANAHFSDDVLSGLLNEPIPGQGVFWSSAAERPYPISMRVFSFEELWQARDPSYGEPEAATYAAELRSQFDALVATVQDASTSGDLAAGSAGLAADTLFRVGEGAQTADREAYEDVDESPDAFKLVEQMAIEALRQDQRLIARLRGDGAAWGSLKAFFRDRLPSQLDDPGGVAYRLVPKAMNEIFGEQGQAWDTFTHPERGTTYIKAYTTAQP